MPRDKRADGLGALDAAVIVLHDAKGGPLHHRELTQRMLNRKLWKSEGKTPWASVQAQMAVEILKKGPESRFRRAGRGLFELTKVGKKT